MKVFISWSGPRSKQLAQALKGWLPNVIQAVDCFYSSDDIRAGQRWNLEINTQLAETDFGVLCVTPENIAASWLNFEAGALAKKLNDESRVVPVTLGFSPGALDDPLRQFNGVEANKDGILKLLHSMVEVGKATIDVDKAFGLWWPELEGKIREIPESVDTVVAPELPGPEELLTEVLGVVRGIARDMSRGYSAALPRYQSGTQQTLPNWARKEALDRRIPEMFASEHRDEPMDSEFERHSRHEALAEHMAELEAEDQARAEAMAENFAEDRARAEAMADRFAEDQARAEAEAEDSAR